MLVIKRSNFWKRLVKLRPARCCRIRFLFLLLSLPFLLLLLRLQLVLVLLLPEAEHGDDGSDRSDFYMKPAIKYIFGASVFLVLGIRQ